MKKYKSYLTNKNFLLSSSFSIIFLIFSLIINFYAGIYATKKASNSVTDLILSHIPVFNVNFIFVYGSFFFWIFIICICIYEPKRIPFVTKSIAVFIIIRSVFVNLTHIGPFPTVALIHSPFIRDFTFGGDLFFSGHTGLPFLMTLIFWKNIRLRIFFLLLSIMFGIVVLMGHLHYSIDVLSAFFITYTIFCIVQYIFPKDYKLFLNGLPRD